MTTWEKLIPGCFAGMSAPFGVHPFDHKRAEKMFVHALHEGATLDDVIREATRWMQTQGVTEDAMRREFKRIREFQPNPYQRRSLRGAWLVTWEGTSPPGRQEDRIVSILSGRISSGTVLAYIERLYIDQTYTLREKLLYARRGSDNPYRATYATVDGNPLLGQMYCGSDPQLFARRVKNLTSKAGENGEEVLTWVEVFPHMHLR